MTERISKWSELTLKGETYVKPTETFFDREDLFLSREEMESKRLCEYILNQEPVLTPFSKMTGFFNCNSSIVGDAFRRKGHLHFEKLRKEFYISSIDNLSTFEWQHATADYKKVLDKGLLGIIEEIDDSLKIHDKQEEIEFLNALKKVALTLISWAHKCSKKALELSKTVENKEYKANLEELSKALLNVPENKPSSFYQAVLTIYLCFSADPDSVGTLDRYLTPFYESDIKNGVINREQAKEYLQELFLMLQSATSINSPWFTRGGESHFCIGGYLPDGNDGFNDLSKLILESLVELPTWIPQVTLRWTAKTPREVLRYAMDMERKDPHKRIAFQNDEMRLKCYTKICGFPFEKAVGYTTAGCNEPVFLGAVTGGSSKINFLRSIETLFHKKTDKIINANDFEEFYQIFLEEFFADLDRAYDYDDKYNREKAKDINYLSSVFFQGCIEKAKSLTNGAGDVVIASPMCIGITNVIDSLIVVKQFVFDEKIIRDSEEYNNTMAYIDNYTYTNNKITENAIFKHERYVVIENIEIDSVTCHSLKEKPSKKAPIPTTILSKAISTEHSKIRIMMTADIKYTGRVWQDTFINLFIELSDNKEKSISSHDYISKNITSSSYTPNKWFKMEVIKTIELDINDPEMKLYIYMLPPNKDHIWNPDHSVSLKDIKISILGVEDQASIKYDDKF